MRYNVIARIWEALRCRLIGIPLVGYFGDCESTVRATLAEEALRVPPIF